MIGELQRPDPKLTNLAVRKKFGRYNTGEREAVRVPEVTSDKKVEELKEKFRRFQIPLDETRPFPVPIRY